MAGELTAAVRQSVMLDPSAAPVAALLRAQRFGGPPLTASAACPGALPPAAGSQRLGTPGAAVLVLAS